LVDDELKVAADVKPLNPELGGDAQAIDQYLIFCHIVGCEEVQSNHIEEPISLKGDQYDASPGPVESERAIKIHAPVLLGDRGKRLLCLDPFTHEIHQSLGLDHHLWDIGYVKLHELESPLGNPSRGEAVSMVMSILSLSSAFYISSVQQKELDFFNNLYRGSPSSPSRDTKRLRVVRYPMSR
jgi:hypothetical protein